MRIGVFTPLLSQLPLAAVLKKLAALQITTVELATGNYPGDAHSLRVQEGSRGPRR
jgi:sugar phosphate isomerase/epimerase